MSAPAELLWRVNNEYRRGLSEVSRYVGLLEQLIENQVPAAQTVMPAVQTMREQLAMLEDEHRGWRYTYFYESADNKRMVQTERDIGRALAYFNRMRVRHEACLLNVYETMIHLPKPDHGVTIMGNGDDLWLMLIAALGELAAFISQPIEYA